jgi:hypothetical protein
VHDKDRTRQLSRPSRILCWQTTANDYLLYDAIKEATRLTWKFVQEYPQPSRQLRAFLYNIRKEPGFPERQDQIPSTMKEYESWIKSRADAGVYDAALKLYCFEELRGKMDANANLKTARLIAWLTNYIGAALSTQHARETGAKRIRDELKRRKSPFQSIHIAWLT